MGILPNLHKVLYVSRSLTAMKLSFLLITIISASLSLSGQTDKPVFRSSGLIDYSKTDFSKTDSLDCWSYFLTDKISDYSGGVKPVAQIAFQRTHVVNDTISKKRYNVEFLPGISFEVFDIKDSAYCFERSLVAITVSSCIMPDVGGDIIILGNFIFLNHSVCLSCKRHDNGVDYCRPIINRVFGSVDKSKATTLEQIVSQFPIKGEVVKLPR